jgi:hypothetical protein
MKRSDFSLAYNAGKKAVQGKTPYPAFLGGFLGVGTGALLKEQYSLPWYESGPISALLVVVLAFFVQFIAIRVRRGQH